MSRQKVIGHSPAPLTSMTTMVNGIQRPRQFPSSESTRSTRNPFHEHGFQKSIRKGPICSAIFLLIAVPLGEHQNDEMLVVRGCSDPVDSSSLTPSPIVLVNVMRTTLEGDEVKWKLRDTMGGSPRADTAKYTGRLWQTEQTLGRTLLGETAFARCDVHSVVSPDHKSIINDWIFLVCRSGMQQTSGMTDASMLTNRSSLTLCPQEERDHVNVAVYTKEGKFLVFRQRKYAIPGDTLSPVGGFIDDKESPFDAARREVVEELGVGSKHTAELLKKARKKKSSAEGRNDSCDIPTEKIELDEFQLAKGEVIPKDEPQWVFLGRYRTAANRGGGFLYSYLLMDAIPVVEHGGTPEYLGTGDAEEQKLLSLSKEEIETALLNGEFQEVKWTATMSLSLMHIQKQSLKSKQ